MKQYCKLDAVTSTITTKHSNWEQLLVHQLSALNSFRQVKRLELKPGLHEPQLQVQWSVRLLYYIVVERVCLLTRARSSVARL